MRDPWLSLAHLGVFGSLYLGYWKFTPHWRFSWNVAARSMELIGVLFCSPCNVMKLRVSAVYQ